MGNKTTTVIIGAGISGLGASYSLREKGYDPMVLEKGSTYGGLCGSFETIPGFRFDRFVHLSFATDDEVNQIFRKGTENRIITHIPNPFNIYKGKWIKHPAQNNLYPLDEDEKQAIIEDFKKRPTDISLSDIKNYEEWLRVQYGDTFAERFPMQYTPKYWMHEAQDLETKWVGIRMYQPSVEEVIAGAESPDTPLTYYAKEMRYPEKGGYKAFLKELAKDADIRYNEEVVRIDPKEKTVTTASGNTYRYDRLISSMPLPSLIKALDCEISQEVKEAADGLKCTSGYQISIALKGENIPPYLWWYIYDRDILPARVYSPSLKSKDNVPEGCSSLQLEVYCKENEFSREELIERSVDKLVNLGIINREDILDVNIRFEPWANVVFTHDIYENREIVLNFVRSLDIEPIGRFGLWDYLWSDQSLKSGLNILPNF